VAAPAGRDAGRARHRRRGGGRDRRAGVYLLAGRKGNFIPIRLAFARYLTLALELQLAADILSTSVAPTWDRIGKLAAIAVIRTAPPAAYSTQL
jgi:hypothetical protein